MQHIFKSLIIVFLSCFSLGVVAQTNVWRDIYKVKKKDTIYGIAASYGLTVDELINANPEMKHPDFKLKKGNTLFIPYEAKKETAKPVAAQKMHTMPGQTIRIGVMLPLHDVDGDGRRMVEYYRGILMGCDSLRTEGINTDIHAWNVNVDTDIRNIINQAGTDNLDIIFGPLYTKQVTPLADFCKQKDIKLVIPFSISADDVQRNPQVYQIYQNGLIINDRSINAFLERFVNCNPIFIDCNDTTSQKGIFTFGLRKQLETKGIAYQITNLKSSLEGFRKSFVADKRNVVILNTGRSPELNLALRKLNELKNIAPGLDIAMYGYTEWLQYESTYRELFHKYETYIPATFYYYRGISRVASFEQNYKHWIGTTMQEQYIPRFAITGFDHAQFFVRGLYERGSDFQGTTAESRYKPMQTPLRFKKAAVNGGMQNTTFQLVHYKRNGVIETISY